MSMSENWLNIMSEMINLKELVARQLNDHHDSPSGAQQNTYFEWTEEHITDALVSALTYLYSLAPEKFSDLKTFTTTKETCIINFCAICSNFLSVVDVGDCSNVNEITGDVNSLSSLLSSECSDSNDTILSTYEYEVVNGSDCTVKFAEPVKKGVIISYMCASHPDATDLDNSSLVQYHSILISFALWLLMLTDSESKSNLDRAGMYYRQIQDYVELKLLLDFSLREDDYFNGRRRVDDR